MGDGAEKRLRLFAGNLADLEQYRPLWNWVVYAALLDNTGPQPTLNLHGMPTLPTESLTNNPFPEFMTPRDVATNAPEVCAQVYDVFSQANCCTTAVLVLFRALFASKVLADAGLKVRVCMALVRPDFWINVHNGSDKTSLWSVKAETGVLPVPAEAKDLFLGVNWTDKEDHLGRSSVVVRIARAVFKRSIADHCTALANATTCGIAIVDRDPRYVELVVAHDTPKGLGNVFRMLEHLAWGTPLEEVLRMWQETGAKLYAHTLLKIGDWYLDPTPKQVDPGGGRVLLTKTLPAHYVPQGVEEDFFPNTPRFDRLLQKQLDNAPPEQRRGSLEYMKAVKNLCKLYL